MIRPGQLVVVPFKGRDTGPYKVWSMSPDRVWVQRVSDGARCSFPITAVRPLLREIEGGAS